MTYEEILEELFQQVPSFQKVGAAGYKEGMENTFLLDELLHHPHRNYRTIHIAGTNGKGSTAHTLAAILQTAGYKVGLYTSPHLVDFRERIRVNGEMLPKSFVMNFIGEIHDFIQERKPSFFEITTAMAFSYFNESKVDIAVIETGLGGRLDCTNIIQPILSVITNISFDHTQFLGHTIADISCEKAGIIKEGVPVIIGETRDGNRQIFQKFADEKHSPIIFCEDHPFITRSYLDNRCYTMVYETTKMGILIGELGGACQVKNTNTILHAVEELKKQELPINIENVKEGLAHVCELTGLKGRWQILATSPLTVCDTAHNEGGFHYISRQLHSTGHRHLHIVFGMVKDKDIDAVLRQMPQQATYYFTKASIPRALNENELKKQAARYSLRGDTYSSVAQAYESAKAHANAEDFIYIGGSSFVVADLLGYIQR